MSVRQDYVGDSASVLLFQLKKMGHNNKKLYNTWGIIINLTRGGRVLKFLIQQSPSMHVQLVEIGAFQVFIINRGPLLPVHNLLLFSS